MKNLTPKQIEILDFIERFQNQHQCSPSYREVMVHFEFSSLGSVYKHVHTLMRKGALAATKNAHRSLMLMKPNKQKAQSISNALPLIGNLVIPYPLELFVQPQMIDVPSSLVHNLENTYILQVQGESLKDEWLLDGDLILIEARTDIQQGEMILGLINQNHTVLKRYYPEGNHIRLESQHSQITSLTINSRHISILGVLVGVMRSY